MAKASGLQWIRKQLAGLGIGYQILACATLKEEDKPLV
jgi:hypothetical protein